jgi:arabinose-5-phosphate isomerase
MSSTRKAETPDTRSTADLEAARRVLVLESDAIKTLADGLDGAFVAAVGECFAAKGRVVVSGMGKSGHIARKIAATMASTGTPAQFVHPGEASHGDLGMITGEDVVLCLSNSGETTELDHIVAYSRRFDIPLIAMVGRRGSTLEEAADITLALPNSPEACPLGLAPTTSTTLMLALGDALAVALLERRGFSADQFQLLHPGGKLGRVLVKVGDIMHTGESLPLVERTTPMSDALLEMSAKSFGCVGVVDEGGTLVGVITDGDLRRHMNPALLEQPSSAVMTAAPKTIRLQALAAEALGRMNTDGITSLFVVEDGKPIGLIRMHDCLQAGVA